MKLSTFRCPNCHASIEVAGDASRVTCTYCQTIAHVARRTGFWERADERPPGNLPTAVQQHSKRFVLSFALLGMTVALIAAAIGAIWFAASKPAGEVSRALQQAATSLPSLSPKSDAWKPLIPGRPLLHDVDGDGIVDVVSRHRNVLEGDVVAVGALSGNDGSLLWRSESLGTYSELYRGELAIHGQRLYLGDDRGMVHVVSLADGAELGTVPLGEKLKRLCASGPEVWAQAEDLQWHAMASSRKAAAEPKDCQPLVAEEMTAATLEPHRSFVRREMDGMSVRFGQRLGDGTILVVGTKHPGTAVPMMARYRAEVDPARTRRPSMPRAKNAVELSRRMKQQRAELEVLEDALAAAQIFWVVTIPQREPLAAALPEPMSIAANGDSIAVVYEGAESRSSLVVFDLSSGKPRFEQRMGERTNIRGVVLTGDSVVLSSWGGLRIYDARSGELRLSVGD